MGRRCFIGERVAGSRVVGPSKQRGNMKDKCGKSVLTFGEFVVAVYAAWGKRRAPGLVRLAVDAHLVEFLGGRRFAISRKRPLATARSLPPGGLWHRNVACLSHDAVIPTESLSASVSSGLDERPTLSER
jgi:hypothetical protein